MSKESWKIEFGKITEVIDRLSYVGNKLKHTSSKLKANTISNKQHFRNKDYRKAVTDQLLVVCNKYKKRIEHIENICALRVKNILKSKSDTDKPQNSNNTWSELLKVNVPSQICLQRFTSCQVVVNRISGNKLRNYKLYTNSRHISSNTRVTSSDDDAGVWRKRKKLKPNTNLRDNIKPKSAECMSDHQSDTKTSEIKNRTFEIIENVHSSKGQKCSRSHLDAPRTAEKEALPKSGDGSANQNAVDDFHHDLPEQKCSASETPTVLKHSDFDSEHKIYRSKNDINVRSNCNTIITKNNLETYDDVPETKISEMSKHRGQRNHSDHDVSDVEMRDFKLSISSDDTEIISDNEKSLRKGDPVKECSDAQSKKLVLALSTEGTVQSNEQDIELTRHKHKTILSSEDYDNLDTEITVLSDNHIHKENKTRSKKAFVSSDGDRGTKKVSFNDTSETSTRNSEEVNAPVECVDQNMVEVSKHQKYKPQSKKVVFLSDKDPGTINVSDNDKSLSSTPKIDENDECDKCIDEEITELSKQHMLGPKSDKTIFSINKDTGTKNINENGKSFTSKPKSDRLNQCDQYSDDEIPEFSKQHKLKPTSKKTIVSGDKDTVTDNISDNAKADNECVSDLNECLDTEITELAKQYNKTKLKSEKAINSSDENTDTKKSSENDKAVSVTSKSGEQNKCDFSSDKEIQPCSKQLELEPKIKETIVSSNEDKSTNNVSDNDKSVSSTSKSDDENVLDKYSDTEITELSKQQKPKPKSKKTIVFSDEDEGTNKVSDNDRTMSSTPKSDDENISNKYSDTKITELAKQKHKLKSKKTIVLSDEDKGTKKVSYNDKTVSTTPKSDDENVHDKYLDTEITELAKQQKPKPKSKKTIVIKDEDKGTNKVSDNDKTVSSTPNSDDENVHDKYLDTEITELAKQQKPKAKSKKTIVINDEDKGTNKVSDNDKTVSSTPKSNDENVHDKYLDTGITELAKQQKPKPKSKKTIVINDEDKGTNKVSDNDKTVSSTPKSDDENISNEYSDSEITELAKQKHKPKSKKTIDLSDEDKGTKKVSDNDKTVSSTPKSDDENVHDKYLDTEITELAKQQKPKAKSKKTIVINDEDKGTNKVSDNDKTVSSTPKSDDENISNEYSDSEITELAKQKHKPKSKKTIALSDEDKGTKKVSDNDKTVSSTLKSDDENVHNKYLDTEITELAKQQKPKAKSKKTIVINDEDKGTNKVSDNDKTVSSTPKSDDENISNEYSDSEITELAKQKHKPKSKKTIDLSDEDKGTKKVSDNDKTVSSTPKSDDENVHDKYLDTEITKLVKQQKPKPKSTKTIVINDEDKGTNKVIDHDKSVSPTPKSDDENIHDKCWDTEITKLAKRQKLKPKSKNAVVSAYKDSDTKNISDNGKSVSATLKSNEENECNEYLNKEIPELPIQKKPKQKNKKAFVLNENDTDAKDVCEIDYVDSNRRQTDDVSAIEKECEKFDVLNERNEESKLNDKKTIILHNIADVNASLVEANKDTEISHNVDVTCNLFEKEEVISSSCTNEISTCADKTMNVLLDFKNVPTEQEVSLKQKTGGKKEFSKGSNGQEHTPPTISPNPEGPSVIEEIILSDTDCELDCANDEKENNENFFLKCVDIKKLTSQVTASCKPSDADHKKNKVNNKIKNLATDKKGTNKKPRLTLGCQSDKPLVKLREFSVKVCRMSKFDQKFLKNHKLKVIKNFETKQVVVELKQAERNEKAKNDLLGDSSSSASIGRNVKPTKSPSSASKRKRQRRIMRAKERLMSVSSTDTEEELVQNALKKIKRELRMSQTDKSPNKQSPNKQSPNKWLLNKQSPRKQKKLFFSSRSSSSETDEMLQKALKKVSNQIENVKSGVSKSEHSSESDPMGRSLRRNRGNAQCEQESSDKEENNKSADSTIENLTNLKNLKKTRRGHADTSSSEDGHQSKKLKQKALPSPEEKKSEPNSYSEDEDKTEEQIKSNDDITTIEDDDDSDSMPDMPKVFRMKGKSNADLAKQELLRDSGDTSATDKADDETHNKAKKEQHSSSDEEEKEDEKKKSNGKDSGKKTRSRSDRLLRGKLDLPSSSEERDSSTSRSKQEKPEVDSDKDGSDYEKAKSDSDSDDSVDFKRTNKRKPMHKKSSEKESDDSSKSSCDGQTKKKRRRIKAIADSDASDNSDSGSEGEGGKKSGRKNIRKVIRKDQLEEATKKAAREERERVARIQDRQKLYNNTAFDESGKPDEVVLDKVVLDFDPETKEPLISVDPGLVKKLKPHQANGIKFMWDACFESVKQIKKGKGSGCILAHCMGLGKTLQVVSLTHTLLAHWELTKVRRVLVVCPLSTVLNWVNEFRMWLKLADNDIELNIFELSKFKQNYERSNQMEEWMECGGVCVLGYEMFRNLSADNPKKFRKKMLRVFQESLVDPGPDLVVCDEGHLLKNEKTSLSQSMNRIKTIRRIVLTGTPLQNNLKEYYCMVQFVKQNLLGKYNEYLNRFVNPITNGQYTDSTDHDIRIMKRRSHVLHKLLDGAVQRRDYGVLAPFLPPKHEYIIFITLTEVQIKLYTYYLENLSRRPHPDRKSTSFLFPDFQAMQRIWTHPLVLKANSERYEIMQQKKKDKEDEDEDSEGSLIDFIDDESTTEEETTEVSSDESAASDDSRPKRAKAKKKNKKNNKKARSTRANPVKPAEPSPEKDVVEVAVEQKSENWTEWWLPLVTDDQLEDMRNSNKLLLLFQILKECEAIGDKLLVFSQSLYSLDLIEHFLCKIDEATQNGQSEENLAGHIGSWSPGLDYFRLDGQTSCENRSLWCKSFNKESNPRARLFLISTRAGGLGINLVAANRVVIFDMSWNPSHDVQSIFRVYRFGQKKPCYIYRFLAMGTMEEKIYERQVTKQAISKRVIDEQQIDRHYAENDLAELYQFTPRPEEPREVPLVPKDRLFAEMLKSHEDAIYKYHEHDSLLENKEEETLTEEERKAAWDDFENEKNRPPPPPMTYNQNYNGINNMMNPNSVAFAALANMLRRDYPQLTDQQLAAMMPSILYQADPSLYGGYDFNMMNSLMNSQYGNTAMQPNLMMNPGGGMGGVGAMSGAAVGGSALRGALGGMSGGLAYQPMWQQQQQMQMQRLMQQQQQQKAQSQSGMKFYAGGLGSRDPISMALQQQKQREMILGGGSVGGMSAGGLMGMSAGGLPNSSLPARGRPPKPKPTLNTEVVTLDDSD